MGRLTLLSLLLLLPGCAAMFPPEVDASGVEPAKYNADMAECQDVADQAQPEWQAGQGVAIGSAFGAGIGAIIGGFAFGAVSPAVWWGMLAGGGTGALVGGDQGFRDQRVAYSACLRERGYTIKSEGKAESGASEGTKRRSG